MSPGCIILITWCRSLVVGPGVVMAGMLSFARRSWKWCRPEKCFEGRLTLSLQGREFSTELLSYDLQHPECNVSPTIAARIGKNLHLQENHPLWTIKNVIETYWKRRDPSFRLFDNLSPVVSTAENFDSLLIPTDHVSRSRSDTYYLRDDTVLRTHATAHQPKFLREGLDKFLVTGDVYRRDEIDMCHYPVFHQMDAVRIFDEDTLDQDLATDIILSDLKEGLEGMVGELFGDVEMRWVDAYFPFTHHSLELEIYFEDEWLEVLGCGVIQPEIIRSSGRGDQQGWAFGLGLERLAMVLFSIPDIRLFWSQDPRFHSQFEGGGVVKFQPYSKYPPCLKDVSFWTNSSFHPNDLNEVVREVAGDLVEKVELIDSFEHPKTLRESNCFRISYRSMDRSLTNSEIDDLQEKVRIEIERTLNVELR